MTAYSNEKLVGFAPCFYDFMGSYFWFGLPLVIPYMKNILNLSNRIHLNQNNVLMCYSPFCYRTKILLDNNFEREMVIRKLSEEIDLLCKKEKILFSSFMFVSEFDKHLLKNLENCGYHKSLWRPTLYLDVRWQNFEGYLESLSPQVRRSVKREIKKCAEKGITIEKLTEFKDLSNILSNQALKLAAKYNNKMKFFEPDFYESLSNYAKSNTIVFAAKKKDELIGFSLCLRKGDTLDVFHCGFNYDVLDKTDFVYFNVGYYTPIEWAIQEGLKKIFYRIGVERLKYKRGCKPEFQYNLTKCHNRLLGTQISLYLMYKNKKSPAPTFFKSNSKLFRDTE